MADNFPRVGSIILSALVDFKGGIIWLVQLYVSYAKDL